ncbi:MAG TPA: GH92 family glycosyl hydrolase [Oleiagrimonas sp.]|nr:GH92 family glycosyl hydrolase [Oleiagrimonas sp.]
MVTRRRFMQGAAALALVGGSQAVTPRALAKAMQGREGPANQAAGECSRHVDVFIGTGGHGHTFPGATMPFGMVQLSPDTNNSTWDDCSGYHQRDGSIMGFSHTHLSGTGGADMLDFLLMPAQGPVLLEPGERGLPHENYRSRFDAVDVPDRIPDGVVGHPGKGYRSTYDTSSEKAQPGYYRVHLTENDILAELTATLRAGLHRYTFGKPGKGHLLIDLVHGFHGDPDEPANVSDASLELIGNDTLVGGRRVHQWANGRYIYFAMKLSRPIARTDLYSDDKRVPHGTRKLKGKHLKAALHIDDVSSEPLLVKVGISAVDSDGAMRNLESEISDWDFDGVQRAAADAWEKELSRIRIRTPSESTKRIFYSALYHTMLAPTLFSDVDNRYRGMDLKVHKVPAGHHNYSTYSLWDTYRAEHPLLTLYRPDIVPDLVQGLVRKASESPDGPPVWPLQGVETGTMIGYHSISVIAEAQAKGFDGVDYQAAWAPFRERALVSDREGLGWYRKLGYDPSDKDGEAVSKTIEYAYDYWAMAHLADALGKTSDATTLRKLSLNYRNVFDREITFMRPRDSNGKWMSPFDPRSMGHSDKWRDFTESNSWQATFGVQHDLYGYMEVFGGVPAFERKLDELFTTSSELPADAPPDIAGLVGQYCQGNEPSHHIAYLYAYTGSPWKTQSRVRMLLKSMYRDGHDGLAGNEDCGQMSAWYVMGALGLYAVDPVSTHYVFGSPLLERADVNVGHGRTLGIRTLHNGVDKPYIQSVTWNGKPWRKSWISHAELVQGGVLEFTMGSQPNKQFGKAAQDRPPSFGRLATEA